METIYDGVLLGAALLCAMRAIARRDERVAWALLALGLALYAGGNIYWSLALADLEEAPFPSIADGLWLGCYLFFYVGDRAARHERGCRASASACGSTA